MGRLRELDSIRGLAALSVLCDHFLQLFPIIAVVTMHIPGVSFGITIIKYSPLHLFWAGSEAVVLFFILSGFVLSLPFYLNKQGGYVPFIIKRVLRIYPAYILAILAGMAMDKTVGRHGIHGLSSWFNGIWQAPITTGLFLNHVFMLESFNNGRVDPVIWSLVHEMRISIVFPFLMIVVTRFNWKISLGLGLLCSLIAQGLQKVFGTSYDYALTFHFIIMFIVGALLAKHRVQLIDGLAHLSRLSKVLIASGGIVFYTSSWLTPWIPITGHWILLSHLIFLSCVRYWCITVGASIFIVFGLASAKCSSFLQKRTVTFLGDISYSLYLFHAVILLTFVNWLYGIVPMWVILSLSFVVSIAIATVVHRCVEQPFILLGKRVTISLHGQPKTELDTPA